MLERPPGISSPISFGLLTGAMIELARRNPGDLKYFFQFAALLFAFLAVITVGNWMLYNATLRARQVIDARVQSPASRIMDALSHCNKEQLEYAMTMRSQIVLLPGEPNPLEYALMLGNEMISYTFIHQFTEQGIATGGRRYLCPISLWSEGTRERTWAVMITQHLVSMGYAEKASGNHPAKWINFERGMAQIGALPGKEAKEYNVNTLNWSNLAFYSNIGKETVKKRGQQ